MRLATRDYARQQKPQRTAPPRSGRANVRKGGKPAAGNAALGLPLWAWMVVSLSLVVFAGALYYVSRPVVPMDMAPSSGEKLRQGGRTIEIPPKEPSRFAFYEMLPSYEVVVPEEVINPPKPKAGTNRNNLPRETVAGTATAATPDLPADLQAAIEPPPIVEKPVTATLPKTAEPVATTSVAKPVESKSVAAVKAPPTPRVELLPQPTAQLGRGERFLIQVAAFRSRADAEQRVAALTLAGLAARVEQVTIDDKDTWFRVRLGPYGSASAAAAAQQSLKAEGFSGVVLKVKS